MGMFDNISVSDALPFSEEMKQLGLDKNDYQFQTKDLDSLMSNYIIQGGKLFIEKYKHEKYIEGKKDSKLWHERIGRVERSELYLEDVKYHGTINFYDFRQNVLDKWDCWIEFKAIFTNGVLDKFELVEFRKTDNSERIEREKQWKDELKKTYSVWYNKYFFHTAPVRWFEHKIWYRTWSKLGNICNRIANGL